jgi:hypothetical protein
MNEPNSPFEPIWNWTRLKTRPKPVPGLPSRAYGRLGRPMNYRSLAAPVASKEGVQCGP